MALFCTVIGTASVSLKRFPPHSHSNFFSYAFPPVFRLNSPYICFTSRFCFLLFIAFLLEFMLPKQLLAVVIKLSLIFWIYDLRCCIDASTLSTKLERSLLL